MTTPPKRLTRKQKRRADQVREAQRRRRERLRTQSCTFLQLILSSSLRTSLEKYSEQAGMGLQEAASRLMFEGLRAVGAEVVDAPAVSAAAQDISSALNSHVLTDGSKVDDELSAPKIEASFYVVRSESAPVEVPAQDTELHKETVLEPAAKVANTETEEVIALPEKVSLKDDMISTNASRNQSSQLDLF